MAITAPFGNESEVTTIGDLTIENRIDRVSFFGSIELTRDKAGLHKARELKSIIDAVTAKLESETLPNKVKVEPQNVVDNPFAGNGKD